MKKCSSAPLPALLMFTDIIDSSMHSAILGVEDYARRVLDFQDLFEILGNIYFPERAQADSVVEFCQLSARGDEGLIFLLDHKKSGSALIMRALRFAFELKARWLLANRKWASSGGETRNAPRGLDIAVGIHYGTVVPVTETAESMGESRNLINGLIGYSINYAKRVESASRIGKWSRVFVSKDAAHLLAYSNVLLYKHSADLKGLGAAEELFEVRALLDDMPLIGRDAGVEEDDIKKSLAGGFTEQELMREYWLRGFFVSAGKCVGSTDAQAQNTLVWGTMGDDDPVCLLQRARDCSRLGKNTMAISYLKAVLAEHPRLKSARIMLIDNCWKVALSGSNLGSEYIYIRDTADELLTNSSYALSVEEKTQLRSVLDEINKKQEVKGAEVSPSA